MAGREEAEDENSGGMGVVKGALSIHNNGRNKGRPRPSRGLTGGASSLNEETMAKSKSEE